MILKTIVAVVALTAYAAVLSTLTMRGSLLLAFVPSVLTLYWGRRSLKRMFVSLVVVYTALAVVPIDVAFDNTGTFGVQVIPFLWGLPNEFGREMIENRERFPAGCIVPMYPARYALVLTR